MTTTTNQDIIQCSCCRLKHSASDFGNTRLKTDYRTCKRCRSKNKRRYAKAKAKPNVDSTTEDNDKKLLMDFKDIFFNENHIMNIINGICLTLPQRQLLMLYREYNGNDATKTHMIRYIDTILKK